MYNFSEVKLNLNDLLTDGKKKLENIANDPDLKMWLYSHQQELLKVSETINQEKIGVLIHEDRLTN